VGLRHIHNEDVSTHKRPNSRFPINGAQDGLLQVVALQQEVMAEMCRLFAPAKTLANFGLNRSPMNRKPCETNVALFEEARRLHYGLLLIFLCSILSSGVLCPSASAQGQPMTTRQMRTLSDTDARRVIQRDLSSLLGPVDTGDWGHMRLLPYANVPTRPYGTAYEGLCRRELLEIDYAPTGAATAWEDRPLQPYRVELQAQFHGLHAPVSVIREPGPIAGVYQRTAAARASDASCNALGAGSDIGWFAAVSEEKAAEAVNLLGAALDKIKAGTLAPNSCNLGGDAESCRRSIVQTISPASLTSLVMCVTTSNDRCYEYLFDSRHRQWRHRHEDSLLANKR
jgi:hypothetical protein